MGLLRRVPVVTCDLAEGRGQAPYQDPWPLAAGCVRSGRWAGGASPALPLCCGAFYALVPRDTPCLLF